MISCGGIIACICIKTNVKKELKKIFSLTNIKLSCFSLSNNDNNETKQKRKCNIKIENLPTHFNFVVFEVEIFF